MVPTAPRSLPRRRPRPFVVAVVLALHAVVLGSMLRLAAWRDREPAAQARALVQVHLQWPALRPASASTAPPSIVRPTARPRATVLVDAAPEARPQAIPDLPRPQAPLSPAASTSQRPPPALKLELPRSASAPWRQRSPALDDPRANTARATMESRLADTMGGAAGWVQERLDNDRVRWRRGSECIEMQRSRAGQLDLGGGAFRDSWAATEC